MEKPIIVFYLILSLLFISSSASPLPDRNLSRSSFPFLPADKLIELNLFPYKEVNIVDGFISSSSFLLPDRNLSRSSFSFLKVETGKKIVEKRFKFPNLVEESVGGISLEDLGHHAGYYKLVHTRDARMFYFFFESRNSTKDFVVIWLTGGPGCSGELALFYENGPFNIADNMSLVWNEHGWDKASNLLYVDQPIGTGFSYSSDKRDIRHNEVEVSNDLYDFLQAFFEEHPQFVKNDFYITGESYAGHYIPALASRVHRGNKAREGIHVNLKGFAIGNGMTNPAVQFKAYPDYALNMGIIEKFEYDFIIQLLPLCETMIKLCGTDGTLSCLTSFFYCGTVFRSIMVFAGDKNQYDIRKKCEGTLCYDFSNVEKFLNQKSVKEAIGVGDMDFLLVSPKVYVAMLVDWMRNLEVGIPELLEDGVKLLVYAGEYDLICNWLGNSRWVHAMEWSGQKDFVSSPEIPFEVDGSEAGILRTHGPLSFLKVRDAGHMVPMDQPKASLEMLKRWMQGTLSQVPAGSGKLVVEM